MPTPHRETFLCRYHYDPLDRLVNSTPFEQPTQRYYCKTRLATEVHGGVHRSILQHEDQLLAQQQRDGANVTSRLLATDQQRSVLNALDADQPKAFAYSPYGHRPPENGLLSLLGFNGERPDPVTGHYHLGNGYRQFNPVLMRFNSPDSWSPFGEGGLNAYAYCGGDPLNRIDPNGHSWGILSIFGRPSASAITPEITTNVQGILAKRGMLYKGQTLGYQLGEEANLLKLDDMSIENIKLHAKAIEDSTARLITIQNELLNTIPDPAAIQEVVAYRASPIQYETVLNVSSSKDKAVVNLHSQVMAYEHLSSTLDMITVIQSRSSPTTNSATIRRL